MVQKCEFPEPKRFIISIKSKFHVHRFQACKVWEGVSPCKIVHVVMMVARCRVLVLMAVLAPCYSFRASTRPARLSAARGNSARGASVCTATSTTTDVSSLSENWQDLRTYAQPISSYEMSRDDSFALVCLSVVSHVLRIRPAAPSQFMQLHTRWLFMLSDSFTVV